MKRQLSFSQAIEGFTLSMQARRLSPNTIRDYLYTLGRFEDFLEGRDPPLGEITSRQIEWFLASLQVSNKTLLNYHIGLSSMWTWAVREGYAAEHVVRQVPRPRPEKKAIVPYTEHEVRAMFAVISHSKRYKRPGKRWRRIRGCAQMQRFLFYQ